MYNTNLDNPKNLIHPLLLTNSKKKVQKKVIVKKKIVDIVSKEKKKVLKKTSIKKNILHKNKIISKKHKLLHSSHPLYNPTRYRVKDSIAKSNKKIYIGGEEYYSINDKNEIINKLKAGYLFQANKSVYRCIQHNIISKDEDKEIKFLAIKIKRTFLLKKKEKNNYEQINSSPYSYLKKKSNIKPKEITIKFEETDGGKWILKMNGSETEDRIYFIENKEFKINNSIINKILQNEKRRENEKGKENKNPTKNKKLTKGQTNNIGSDTSISIFNQLSPLKNISQKTPIKTKEKLSSTLDCDKIISDIIIEILKSYINTINNNTINNKLLEFTKKEILVDKDIFEIIKILTPKITEESYLSAKINEINEKLKKEEYKKISPKNESKNENKNESKNENKKGPKNTNESPDNLEKIICLNIILVKVKEQEKKIIKDRALGISSIKNILNPSRGTGRGSSGTGRGSSGTGRGSSGTGRGPGFTKGGGRYGAGGRGGCGRF